MFATVMENASCQFKQLVSTALMRFARCWGCSCAAGAIPCWHIVTPPRSFTRTPRPVTITATVEKTAPARLPCCWIKAQPLGRVKRRWERGGRGGCGRDPDVSSWRLARRSPLRRWSVGFTRTGPTRRSDATVGDGPGHCRPSGPPLRATTAARPCVTGPINNAVVGSHRSGREQPVMERQSEVAAADPTTAPRPARRRSCHIRRPAKTGPRSSSTTG